MKLFARLALPLILGGTVVSAAAAASAGSKKPAGAMIFREKCSMCHGIDGKGYAAIKTPDFTDPKWQAAHSDKERMEAVENGIKGTAMVSFKGKLDRAQMEAVLKYIRSLDEKAKK